jgi:hypothetical protein
MVGPEGDFSSRHISKTYKRISFLFTGLLELVEHYKTANFGDKQMTPKGAKGGQR